MDLCGQREVLLPQAAFERLVERSCSVVGAAGGRQNLREDPRESGLDVERVIALAQSHRLPCQPLGLGQLAPVRVHECQHLPPRVVRIGLHRWVVLFFEGSRSLRELLRFVEAAELAE